MSTYGNSLNDNKLKIIKVILLSCFFMVLIIKGLFCILKNYLNIYFFIGNVDQNKVDFMLNVSIIIIFTLIALLFIRKIWAKVIILILGCVLFLYCGFVYTFDNTDKKYFYFNSPNEKTIFIVEENSWLLDGWSNFYIKENSLFVKKLNKSIRTDDGYRPFTRGNFKLLWIDNNTIKLTYRFGQGNIEKVEIIKIK